MSELVETLRRSRALLERGWAEPMSRTDGDEICTRFSASVWRYCVHDAIHATSPSPHVAALAIDLLEEQALPVLRPYIDACKQGQLAKAVAMAKLFTFPSLQQWLEAPNRTIREVLTVFDRAIVRSRAVNA